jgi:hypothetical protein
MKTKSLLTIILLFITGMHTWAQINNVQHLFPNQTVPSISVTKGKVAWIGASSSFYTLSVLDSNLNTVTTPYSNLPLPDTIAGNPVGVQILNTCYDKAGKLWGLFFDLQAYYDTIMSPIGLTYNGQGCFFLYNFSTSQRNYFYYQNTVGYLTPLEPDFKSTMIMNKDTMLITMFNSTGAGFGGSVICHSKFLNGTIHSTSNALDFSGMSNYYLHTYIDENHFENIITTDVIYQYLQKKDFIHYEDAPVMVDFTHVYTSFMLDSANQFVSYLSNYLGDTLIIKNSSTTQYYTVPDSANNTLWNNSVEICTDHAHRYWVIKNNRLHVLEGSNWTNFATTMQPFRNAYQPNWKNRVFAEFGMNRFVVGNYDFHTTDTIGNGLYYFDYNPSTVGITPHAISQVKTQYSNGELLVTQAEHIKSYYLCDMQGRVITNQQNNNSNFVVRMQNCSAGLYLLQCVSKSGKTESIQFYKD